jgi:hypothetical protein
MDTSDLDYPASTLTPGTLTIGSTDYGIVANVGDEDWFRVSLTAGQSYRFTVEAGSMNGLFDPQLTLYDPLGAVIEHATVGQGFQTKYLDYLATASGEYFVAASGDSGLTGSYRMTAVANDTSVPVGTAGNDTLTGGGGTPIDGGAGTDTVTYTGNRASVGISHNSNGAWTVGTDTLSNIERLQFSDGTIDLTPLTLYANRVQAFFLAWTGRTATPDELTTYAADYAEKAAAGLTIYETSLYTYLHDQATFLASTDYGGVITDMYERLTGSRDVPADMYQTFIDRLGTSWDATRLAVKMIKGCGFWYNNGDFGKPAAFPFDFTASSSSGQTAFEATLDAYAAYDLSADVLAPLVLVGVTG